MTAASLTLVVNPGSASHKYALYSEGWQWANILFEFVDGKVVGKIDHAGQQQSKIYDDTNLSGVAVYVLPLLRECRVINEFDVIKIIGIRLVAPSDQFMQDELINDEVESVLRQVQLVAPLHITTALAEIDHLKSTFPGVPIIAVSDSAFHATKYPWAWNYGIDVDLSNRLNIKRYGYHGISVRSIIRRLQECDKLSQKTIVCHLGSGSSVTAVVDGKSVDTTMGYTPLEGLMMASRSGNMDISAALAVKRALNLDDDGIEQYLNKQSGLLGVSGSSNDIRQLLTSEENGDKKAGLALKLFVYHIQQAIGQMAASMGGVDCLVITGAIGERSKIIRSRIIENLGYLGFSCDFNLNEQVFEPTGISNIATDSGRPVYVISTDEAAEIARRAESYVNI
jgi:acetate kinase